MSTGDDTQKMMLRRITWAVVGLVLGTAINVAISGNMIWQNSRLSRIETHSARESVQVEHNTVQVQVILTKLINIGRNLDDIKASLRQARLSATRGGIGG